MHPIERLRHVARADEAPIDEVFRASVVSLAGFADDPAALVTACRRLLERHAGNGPIRWLCARVLSAADAHDEAWRCLDEWTADPTVRELGHLLPTDGTVVVIGSPDRLLASFGARGDVTVRVVDVEGDGYGFVRRLDALDVVADTVDVADLGAGVATADLVLVDTPCLGVDTVLAAPGTWPVGAVAHAAGVDVWAVAGVGRVVSPGAWAAIRPRLEATTGTDLVPLALVDRVVGPRGLETPEAAQAHHDVPDVAELRR